jgi:hypothetical protein
VTGASRNLRRIDACGGEQRDASVFQVARASARRCSPRVARRSCATPRRAAARSFVR